LIGHTPLPTSGNCSARNEWGHSQPFEAADYPAHDVAGSTRWLIEELAIYDKILWKPSILGKPSHQGSGPILSARLQMAVAGGQGLANANAGSFRQASPRSTGAVR
jgi:hypothetical protein